MGSAREDDASTHGFCEYDVEVDTTRAAPHALAADVLHAWRARCAPGAFARMAARPGEAP